LFTEKLRNHDLYSLNYLGTYWSSADPEKLARRLEEEMRKKTAENNYTQLYLVGRSFGALLLRQAILYAAELWADGRLVE
jgi:type IV secretory pathway VirJ component